MGPKMTETSKCCSAPVEVVDGEPVCRKCWMPCLLESTPQADWPDVEHERLAEMGEEGI